MIVDLPAQDRPPLAFTEHTDSIQSDRVRTRHEFRCNGKTYEFEFEVEDRGVGRAPLLTLSSAHLERAPLPAEDLEAAKAATARLATLHHADFGCRNTGVAALTLQGAAASAWGRAENPADPVSFVSLAFSNGRLTAASPSEAAQDAVIVSTREPQRPQEMSSHFEARCGHRRLVLSGWGGAGSSPPALKLNGGSLALSTEIQTFLTTPGATYRMFAVCPDTTPAVQLLIYRAVGSSDGQVDYDLRALDVPARGAVVDRGRETINADAFWFR